MKNLVLDVNVILDLWLNRALEEDQLVIAGLLAGANANTYQCWVSSSSLSVLEYVARKELKRAGMQPSDAIQATRALLVELMRNARLFNRIALCLIRLTPYEKNRHSPIQLHSLEKFFDMISCLD